MSDVKQDSTKLGFAKTFVVPAVLIFLMPVISLAVFCHDEIRYDARERELILAQICSDATLPAEKSEQTFKFVTEHPFSELLANPQFVAQVDGSARFHYATFRWLWWIALLSSRAALRCLCSRVSACIFPVGLSELSI